MIPNAPFLYPLKISKIRNISYVLRGQRKGVSKTNGLRELFPESAFLVIRFFKDYRKERFLSWKSLFNSKDFFYKQTLEFFAFALSSFEYQYKFTESFTVSILPSYFASFI